MSLLLVAMPGARSSFAPSSFSYARIACSDSSKKDVLGFYKSFLFSKFDLRLYDRLELDSFSETVSVYIVLYDK